ncbi:hypothetical protein LCGC14_0391180, partial [marine sediment metagenome]
MAELGPTPQLYTLDGWPQTWADLFTRLDALQRREDQRRQDGDATYRHWLSHEGRVA